jgi:hypothetical protein
MARAVQYGFDGDLRSNRVRPPEGRIASEFEQFAGGALSLMKLPDRYELEHDRAERNVLGA